MFDFVDLKRLSEDDRGSTFMLEAVLNKGMLLAERKAGSLSGNHWYKGSVSGKNPEKLLLIKGEMEIRGQRVNSTEKKVYKISAPKLIYTQPMVIHTFKAISDCIFLEFNSLEEHKEDTFYPNSK